MKERYSIVSKRPGEPLTLMTEEGWFVDKEECLGRIEHLKDYYELGELCLVRECFGDKCVG